MDANRENIKKWVEALRSGEYAQTTERLSNGRAYCCLGVACEVAIKSGLNLHKAVSLDDSGQTVINYGDEVGELPREVSTWLGLEWEDEDGRMRTISDPQLGHNSAVEWNDKKHADFQKIAALIETEFLQELPGRDPVGSVASE